MRGCDAADSTRLDSRMILILIVTSSQALRKSDVPYVVAPYEADAQLAFLERQGIVDGVISDDSDLIVFGCQTVIFL